MSVVARKQRMTEGTVNNKLSYSYAEEPIILCQTKAHLHSNNQTTGLTQKIEYVPVHEWCHCCVDCRKCFLTFYISVALMLTCFSMTQSCSVLSDLMSNIGFSSCSFLDLFITLSFSISTFFDSHYHFFWSYLPISIIKNLFQDLLVQHFWNSFWANILCSYPDVFSIPWSFHYDVIRVRVGWHTWGFL